MAVADVLMPPATSSVAAPASPILPGDHYVLRKLAREVLPWIIAGRRLRRTWYVRLSTVAAYVGDSAAALAGLGVGGPLIAAFSKGGQPVAGTLDAATSSLPAPLVPVGIVALFVWVALRVVMQREDVTARALLAKQCARNMQELNAQLWMALRLTEPMPQITVIQTSLGERVQNAISSGVWPWDPLPPPEDYAVELSKAVDDIRAKFMDKWAPPPSGVT